MNVGSIMTDNARRSMRSRRWERERYRMIKNPLLGRDVRMNEASYASYMNISRTDRDIYPYQSLDMARKGNVRFAHRDNIERYRDNRAEFTRIMNGIKRNTDKKITFDLVSDIDIFKMRRDGTAIDAKYLIQQDPNITSHLTNMVRLQEELDKVSGFIFLPYIPDSDMNVESLVIEPHNRYSKMNIVNNEEFVAYLRTITDPEGDELGRLIFEFNKIFYYYDTMLSTLSEYIDRRVTKHNLIDSILQFEKMRIYGMTRDNISRRLKRRNQELKEFKTASDSCNLDESYDRYLDLLSKGDRIVEHDMIDSIRNCNAASIDIDDLIYEGLDDFTTNDQYLGFCKSMKFAPVDTFGGYTYQPICLDFVANIKNDAVRNNLLNEAATDRVKTRCLNLPDNVNIDRFDLLEQFMPEWHEAIYQNSMADAFEHRQLLIGDTDITTFMRLCSLIYRSDPFISKECHLPGLIHDIELNKVVVSCIANSDDVFPIRIVDGNLVESIQLYEPFKVTDGDRLLGSISIKMKGRRTDHEYRYYNSYLYYNKDKRFKLVPVNFRSNVMIPGTIIEHVRVLYLEMNTLLYYHEDVGTKLHFYKYVIGDNFDILVSKYTMDEIRDKYRSFTSLEENAPESLDRLIEVRLEKNHDKRFRFVEIGNQFGGAAKNDTDKSYKFNFKCVGGDGYKWNIQTGDESVVFDKEVFSISLHNEQIKVVDRFFDLAGREVYNTKCTPINYLKGITTPAMARLQTEQIKKIWEAEGIKKKDRTGKLYEDTLALIDEKQTILSYSFESTLGIYFYRQLSNYLKPNDGAKYLIFSKNHYLLDAILLYSKSVLFSRIGKDITFFLYAYNYEVFDKVANYLQVNKIKPDTIDGPMNNDWIEKNENSLDKVDYSVIDIVIGIDDLAPIRYAYLFQSQLPPIILSLKKLNMGGAMVVNINLIPNRMIFNFVSFLSCMFEEAFIDDFWESDLYGTGQLIHSIVIFRGFKGVDDNDLNNMMNLNKTMYEFDKTGGYGFNTKDVELKELFGIDNLPEKREVASKYVTNIIDFDNKDVLNEQYREYKEYAKMKFLGSIRNFTERMDIFLNKNDHERMKKICTKSKATAIYLAKKYDFPLLDWAEGLPDEYFDKMIENSFESINYTYLRELSKETNLQLSVSKTVRCDYCPKLEQNYAISELAYLYIEKINYDKYKGIEIFINKKYKDLNRLIQTEYGININGKYVSRAWIKFFELLSDTDLLEGFENNDELNVFHICEAPGNFINSMTYFIDKNTNIKNHNWTAQSLSHELAKIYDHYGFMKETREKWDMGPKDTGDIMDKENFDYYLDKFGGVDFLVGDCGEAWAGDPADNKNLTIYQMLYALLVPRTGGGFVIKSYAGNYNKLYLSLLHVARNQYESVMIFKSNTNFWSQEVYIVGKNKKELTTDDQRVLLECLESLDRGDTVYPVDVLPDSFIQEYDKIVHDLVSHASNIKKFFVFLSTNDKIYYGNKNTIAEIVKVKNDGWIDKYLRKKGLAKF
jgi:FtsJ-like methyltransferase